MEDQPRNVAILLFDAVELLDFTGPFQVAPRSQLKPGKRFVDNGRVITAAGVSAGIDASLYAVAKLNGIKQATSTAQRIEYNHWDPSCADNIARNT